MSVTLTVRIPRELKERMRRLSVNWSEEDPAYTSKLAEVVARELGLDRHTTSAYILALEYLGLNPKATYQNLHRP